MTRRALDNAIASVISNEVPGPDPAIILRAFAALTNQRARDPGALKHLGYRDVETLTSRTSRSTGHAHVHKSCVTHPNVRYFGNVIVLPGSELGPNVTVFGPTVIGKDVYIGPGVELRRSIISDSVEVSHMSYVGHSVVGARTIVGAFFCSAVRRLDRQTIRLPGTMGGLQTGDTHFGAIIGSGVDLGVRVTTMPGSIIAANAVVPPMTLVSGIYPEDSRR